MGKRSAQARRAGGVRDQSRMAVTATTARGAAREPDGGMPERLIVGNKQMTLGRN